MAHDIQDVKIFSGSGLDQDSDLLAIQGADSRYRLNVILSEEGNYEVISNIKGNTLHNLSTLPSGTNKVIGFVEDKENKAGIYFVYNSNTDHSIVRFNSIDETFDYIIKGVNLGFEDDKYIDAGIIGSEDEQYLIWVDEINPPRIINIKLGIDDFFSLDTLTDAEVYNVLSFYKYPPQIAPRCAYASNGSKDFNYIKNKSFQFAIRLKYIDKTFSPLSPYSNIPIPNNENLASGSLENSDFLNNEIDVLVDINSYPDLIDTYQIVFRIIDIGAGTPGSWFIYAEYPVTGSVYEQKSFYNDKTIGIIDDDEAIRIQDYVPDISRHLGIIDDNRVVFAGITEGFDNLDVNNTSEFNVSLNIKVTTIDSGDEGLVYESFENVETSNPTISYTVSKSDSDDYYYAISVYWVSGATFEDFTVSSSYGLDQGTPLELIEEFIDGLSSDYEITATHAAGSDTLTIDLDGGSTETYTIRFYVLEKTPTLRSLKTQAVYKLGIRYSYNGKIGSVQTNGDDGIFPTTGLLLNTTNFNDLSQLYCNYTLSAELTINHTAPAGATSYQIVSFGSNIDYYEEYLLYADFRAYGNDAAQFTMYSDGENTVIRRDDMVNRFRAAYSDGINYGMDISEGDIIRFVGRFIYSPDNTFRSRVSLFSDIVDYRINYVSSTEIKISSSAFSKLYETLVGFRYPLLIQIIRIKNNFDAFAQEVSRVYEISADGYHSGNTQTQTISQPAILNLEEIGDCYKSKQVFLNSLNRPDYANSGDYLYDSYGWMEKPMISLYYDSLPTIVGRINVVNEFAQQITYNKLRWSGKFFEDSGVNYLTRVEAEDGKDLDDRNGLVSKVQQIGNVLKVYQERKITSFYLKTVSSIDALGGSQFVFSDEVMSDGRQSIDDYGCSHFTSYVKNVRNAYFFDIINGCIIRDSANGYEEISDYKMHSYFEQKSREILVYSGTVDVFGGWDDELGMYIISFVDLSNLSDPVNETLAFSEKLNRWVSFYSFLPEYYGKISGGQLLSFRNAQVYDHNVSLTRNNFYGTQYSSEIWIHSNQQGIVNKIFNSITINSNNRWSCPDYGSISIERPIAMESRLVGGKFRLQEGLYHSEFMRDSLNGGSVSSLTNLINGRQLRGKEITIKIENDDVDQTLLESVIVNSSISS